MVAGAGVVRARRVFADAAGDAAGARSDRRNAPLEAIRLLAVPAFLVLFIVTFMDALVHQCYFQWTSPFLERAGLPANWIMPAMSIGQIAEIATMAVLGLVLRRLGWRRTMAIGIAAHAARFFIYAIGDPLWLMVAVNVVHGMCYAFFFAAVYIFVDEHFPKDSRASAQGLFNLLILGLGPFVGSLLVGRARRSLRPPPGRSISAGCSWCRRGWRLRRSSCSWSRSGRRRGTPHCPSAARRRRLRRLADEVARVVRAAHARVLRDLRIGAERTGHLDPVVDHAAASIRSGALPDSRQRSSGASQFT